jgi:hypothetical protein
MEKPMKTCHLPKTDSIRKLAKFWDDHDLTDFQDQLEEVTEPVFMREIALQLNLPSNEAEAVRKIARSLGLSQEELVREWVRQKLARQPAPRSSAARRSRSAQK